MKTKKTKSKTSTSAKTKEQKYEEELREIEHAKHVLKKAGALKKDESEALFIPAGVLTGMGFGFYYGNFPAGLFLGLGAGFILFAVIATIKSFRK